VVGFGLAALSIGDNTKLRAGLYFATCCSC
jgi:hypothetical protein